MIWVVIALVMRHLNDFLIFFFLSSSFVERLLSSSRRYFSLIVLSLTPFWLLFAAIVFIVDANMRDRFPESKAELDVRFCAQFFFLSHCGFRRCWRRKSLPMCRFWSLATRLIFHVPLRRFLLCFFVWKKPKMNGFYLLGGIAGCSWCFSHYWKGEPLGMWFFFYVFCTGHCSFDWHASDWSVYDQYCAKNGLQGRLSVAVAISLKRIKKT